MSGKPLKKGLTGHTSKQFATVSAHKLNHDLKIGCITVAIDLKAFSAKGIGMTTQTTIASAIHKNVMVFLNVLTDPMKILNSAKIHSLLLQVLQFVKLLTFSIIRQ